MEVQWVYMTTGSKEEARSIGKALVESKLAACVNIVDGMNSIYMWDGKLQDDTEVILIAKTTSERVSQLVEQVKKLHSYSCPCIVGLPVSGGNPDFLQWIRKGVE